MRGTRVAPGLICVAAALLLTVACQQKSPEEQVADLRGTYTAMVNQGGFVAVIRLPEPMEAEDAMEGMEEVSAGDEGGEEMDALADDSMAAPEEPARYDITLDILISTTSREILPRLTIDIVHLTSDEREKQRWPITLNTSTIGRGLGVQVAHKLEDIDYVPGDIFFTEVRRPIASGERGDYPEFSAAP